MRKRFVVIALLLFVAVLLLGQQTFTRYKGSQYDLSIAIPPTWTKVAENKDLGGQLILVKAEGAANSITIGITDIYQPLVENKRISPSDTDRIDLDDQMKANMDAGRDNILSNLDKVKGIKIIETSRKRLSGIE